MKAYLNMDLDEFLEGNASREQIIAFFKDGDFFEEHYEVRAIKLYLRTEHHRLLMYENDFSIEEMLNGRIEGTEAKAAAEKIFLDWNTSLGYKHFNK